MNDSVRFFTKIFIPHAAEQILKTVAVQSREEEIFFLILSL